MRNTQNHRIPNHVSTTACALALGLLAACQSTGPNAPDPEKMLELHREQALGYYEAGALPQAEDQIRKGLDIEPKDDQLKLMLGWVRQRRGARDDLNVAERVFRDLAPRGDYRALLGLAECLERKGTLYDESAEDIASGKRETDAADPKQRASDLRGDAKKYWTEAITNYEAVLKLRPTEGQAMNGLQRTYSLLNQPENSVLWAEKLLAQSAGDLAFWEKQLKRADLQAAEEARFRKRMLDTRELCVATHFNAATLLRKLGRKSEAIEHLDAIVQIDPEQSTAYSHRAQNLFDLGRYEEARANLDDFLRLSELPFDHPDTQRALKTQQECELKLQALNASAK